MKTEQPRTMMCMQCAQHQRTTYNNLFALVPRACVSHNARAQHTTICSLSCPVSVACHTTPVHSAQHTTICSLPCPCCVTSAQHTTIFWPECHTTPAHNIQQFVRSRDPCLLCVTQHRHTTYNNLLTLVLYVDKQVHRHP